MSDEYSDTVQPKRTEIDETHFSVEARLAIQLGRESISSSITAIIELVKNAYDADATKVRIRFSDLKTKNPQMEIEDDGTGMDLDDLKKNWLVIGTPNKAQLRRKKRARILTGEKGLGRLGLDRLGALTILQSKTKDSPFAVELPINWHIFEKENIRLEQVSLKIFSVPPLSIKTSDGEKIPFEHGTRLILKELKDPWDEETIETLRSELSLLVSPFSRNEDFEITIDSGLGLESVDGPISPPVTLLNAAQWKVSAELKQDNTISMEMSSLHHSETFNEPESTWKTRFPSMGKNPKCGPLKFEFYYIPRKKTSLNEELISADSIRKFLSVNQGIRIYRDGFRVKPYGNPNGTGDWLRLAFRRIESPSGITQDEEPGKWRVGYNQVVGAVLVTREENSELLDQTNREGLVDGEAFAHLRAFAEETVRFFEINAQTFAYAEKQESNPREEAKVKADEAIKRLSDIAGKIDSLVDGKKSGSEDSPKPEGSEGSSKPDTQSETKDVLIEVKKVLQNAKDDIEESNRKHEEEDERESREKNTLSNLASLGILAAAFGHETLGWASSCVANAGWLERNLKDNFFFSDPAEEERIRGKLRDMMIQAGRIETFAGFSIGNVKPRKRKLKEFCLKGVIKNVFNTFTDSLSVQRQITLEVAENMPEDDCMISGYPIDWESVLVNLITNSEWALRERKEKFERKIRVTLRKNEDSFVMNFEDSGIGIPSGQDKNIFLPTITNKRDSRGQIDGTGMGLAIVKNFIEKNSNGTIIALDSELGGANFEITVPCLSNESK